MGADVELDLYEVLRAAARRLVALESPGRTMTATDVAHEAYLRLDTVPEGSSPRTTLLCIAARVVREVLVDAARRRGRAKRGGGWTRRALDAAELVAGHDGPNSDLLDLDEALAELGRRSPRQARIVELRYFGGLGHEEIAAIERCSVRTIGAEWEAARAWLLHRLNRSGAA